MSHANVSTSQSLARDIALSFSASYSILGEFVLKCGRSYPSNLFMSSRSDRNSVNDLLYRMLFLHHLYDNCVTIATCQIPKRKQLASRLLGALRSRLRTLHYTTRPTTTTTTMTRDLSVCSMWKCAIFELLLNLFHVLSLRY